MPDNAVLNAALWAAQFAPVFPCLENKRPACPGGFKLARRSTAEVRAIWDLYPGVLVGMPTGEASGFDVLDIDPRNGGEGWLAEWERFLPATRVHWTRSGGQHRLFRHRRGVRNSAGRVGPGIDVRGTGGYVILWPCHGGAVSGGELLADWPDWLIARMIPPPRPPPPAPVSAVEADARAVQLVAHALARLRAAGAGKRHHTLRAVAKVLGGLERFIATPEGEIRTLLVDMAMAAGGEDRDNAERTAQWGLDWGRAHPLLNLTANPFEAHPL